MIVYDIICTCGIHLGILVYIAFLQVTDFIGFVWRPLGDSNPCCRRERAFCTYTNQLVTHILGQTLTQIFTYWFSSNPRKHSIDRKREGISCA